jgi:hypothetical protein
MIIAPRIRIPYCRLFPIWRYEPSCPDNPWYPDPYGYFVYRLEKIT